jgi:hypothetical protein
MTAYTRLGDVAHCRFGDKGDTGLYVIAPYDPADFDGLLAAITPEAVAAQLGLATASQVVIRPCASLGALVIEARGSLGGGVTSSTALDAHGKTRSGVLLAMRIAWG